MVTKEPRLNVALTRELRGLLAKKAAAKGISLSAMAKAMIEEAMELDEDIYFSRLADERQNGQRKLLTSQEFRKRALHDTV